ncbi:nucleoside 2-deoxyribosyltransferase [candidate division KSB1 bacterium]|nr:nucleoside 2-deoxyribosyltransferase [candidate division KSB1 bacterium]
MHTKTAPYQPDFDRLRRTLKRGQADRVPLMELGIHPRIMADFIGRPIETLTDRIEFYRLAGYDYIKLSPVIDMNPGGFQSESKVQRAEDGDLDRSTWGTEGKGIITSDKEFDRFVWAKVEDEMFRDFDAAAALLPPGMQVVGQYGDIFTFTWEFMGFETFSFALVENPGLVQNIFERVGGIIVELFARMAQYDCVGALFYSDDIAYQSGLMISPQALRTYLFPYMRQIGRICRDRDIPFIYHSDGKMWDVMDELVDIGIDALQPIEPQAWDIREVKDRYGDRFCLIGNIDVDLLARGKPEEVAAEVSRLLREVAPGGGYCVGSGNTVPDYVRFDNYRAMLETVWENGAY